MDGFNGMLHELRSCELTRMPKVTGTVLSAGASGKVYFDWITEFYGPIKRHIGLELYLPEPSDLPPGVEWVKSSVADMDGVDDADVDLIFSGQNFEHLFGDDAIGFLLECHRVTRVGGWLVIDSPQREITSALGWTQPEHTIEFTAAEATELVTLAGFDVVSVRGLWLCRDQRTGEMLPLWPEASPDEGRDDLAQAVARRVVLAQDDPANSFVWWLEAQRADREPDLDALRARHAEIFTVAWPERQQRLHNVVGVRREIDGRTAVSVDADTPGYVQFGPYMPLSSGSYRSVFRLRRRGSASSEVQVATLDVAFDEGAVLVERGVTAAELPAGEWREFELSFDVSELLWGGQFRVFATGAAALDVELAVKLVEQGTAVAPSGLRS
jgi:SAM-dependent methyltransferase